MVVQSRSHTSLKLLIPTIGLRDISGAMGGSDMPLATHNGMLRDSNDAVSIAQGSVFNEHMADNGVLRCCSGVLNYETCGIRFFFKKKLLITTERSMRI